MCIVATAVTLLTSLIWGSTLFFLLSDKADKVVITTTDDSSKQDVVSILRKMESYTETGINFREYSSKLLDVNAEFKAATSRIADEHFVTSAGYAMDYFHKAKDYWKKSFDDEYGIYTTADVQQSWQSASTLIDGLSSRLDSQ